MSTRFIVAVIVGTVAWVACNWLAINWGGHLVNDAPIASFQIRASIADLAVATASLLPGMVAGALTGSRGFLIGALIGVCGVIFLTFSLTHLHLGPHHFTLGEVHTLLMAPLYGLSQVVTSSVAGAAGQLLRSNYQSERTRS
jgi:hypothetical protein